MLAVGPYEPDRLPTNPGGVGNCVNAIPMLDGEVGISYRPLPSFAGVPGAGTFPGVPQGGISIVNPNSGGYEVYVCSSTNIYKMNADYTFTSIGSGYNLPAEDSWSILQFGNFLLFTNTLDGMLQYNVVTPGAITAITGAPKARFIFTAFSCVFALDCDGENRVVRNSGFDDHTVWTPGQNGAGFQPIQDGQELIAGAALSDNTAVILQRNTARIMTATGTTQVYNLTKLSENIGSVGAKSCVNTGNKLYFLSTDGFYAIDANGLSPIGANKVNRTFYQYVNEDQLFRTQAAYDPGNRLVNWYYQDGFKAHPAGELSGSFFYSEETNSWGRAASSGTTYLGVYQFATPGYGLDSIDSFGTLDTLPYSLDSRFWLGGQPRLAGINIFGQFGFFDGSNEEATFETIVDVSHDSRLINEITAITDCPGVSFTLYAGDTLNGIATVGSAITTVQRAYVRMRGKYIKFGAIANLGYAWTYFRGVAFPDIRPGGKR